jgi:predicted nucleic acid-binding protein
MRVVDTSAWIERILETGTGLKVAREFPIFAECVMPTMVQLELAKWAKREAGEDASEALLAMTTTCVVIPLDTEIALIAADLCRTHKLATADAVIYGTAQHLGADLLTCDAHFKALPRVIFVGKTSVGSATKPKKPKSPKQ